MSASRNKYIRLLIISSAICLISFFFYWIIHRVFDIQTIEIAGEGITVAVDETKLSKNLLFFPSDRMRSSILRDNELLQDVVFHKKFPHTLVIRPVLRHPFAILKVGTQTFLLDSEGFVLEYGDQGKVLPLLLFDTVIAQKNQRVQHNGVLLAIQSIHALKLLYPVVSVKDIDAVAIDIVTEKMRILFALDHELTQSIATLQTLIEGFRIKGKPPAVVDLRFDKPVVQF